MVAFVAAACSPGDDGRGEIDRAVPTIRTVGDSEGQLNLLTFAGYAEDGSSDPEFDWVHPFERETGCDVHVRYVDSGAEVVRQLTRPGERIYDGATVSGDVAGVLIRAGAVSAIDPALFRHADELLEPLRGTDAAHASDGTNVFG